MTDLKPDLVITDLPDASPSDPLEALSWLGDTVEEVAEGLRARGIKGKPGLASSNCPLAIYLQTWWPTASVAIGGWAIWSEGMTASMYGYSPSACAEFESAYDAYLYPDLRQ